MMSDLTKDIIYRLCMLAESFWLRYYDDVEFKDKETAVFKGEQDDPEWCCDEWTMFKEDYDNITLIQNLFCKPKVEIRSLIPELELSWPMSEEHNTTVQDICPVESSGKSLEEQIAEIPDDVYVFDGLTPDGYIQEIRDRKKNKN